MKNILHLIVFIGPLTLACIFVNCHSSHSHVRYLSGGEDSGGLRFAPFYVDGTIIGSKEDIIKEWPHIVPGANIVYLDSNKFDWDNSGYKKEWFKKWPGIAAPIYESKYLIVFNDTMPHYKHIETEVIYSGKEVDFFVLLKKFQMDGSQGKRMMFDKKVNIDELRAFFEPKITATILLPCGTDTNNIFLHGSGDSYTKHQLDSAYRAGYRKAIDSMQIDCAFKAEFKSAGGTTWAIPSKTLNGWTVTVDYGGDSLGEVDNNPISFKVNKPDTIPMIHSREDSLKYCVVYTDLTQYQQESITGDSIRLRCFTKDKVICNWPKVLPPKFQDKANKIKASVDSTIKNPHK
jgi:hypothetical protein